MPIAGAHLPDIDRSLPGAPRPYRFGIHEGIDMYASTVGVNVAKGTQVLAAADGVVNTPADVDYKEASVAQVNAWLDESMAAHMTWRPSRTGWAAGRSGSITATVLPRLTCT